MDKTVAELKQIAKNKGIRGFSTMNKSELQKAVKKSWRPKKVASPKKTSPKKKPAKKTAKKKLWVVINYYFDNDCEISLNGVYRSREKAEEAEEDQNAIGDEMDANADIGVHAKIIEIKV